VPVFAEADYGPEQVALRYKEYTRSGTEGFVQAYYDILLSAPSAYGKIFRHLSQEDASPFLVNCTAGKDRTGVVVALLLSLAGVPEETIADEYALTDLGLADLKPIFIERLLRNPVLEGNREGVGNMVSSKKENMVAALEMIQKEFGGAEKYMKEKCGLNDDEVDRIRRNLVAEKN
jgi:protein tyrosine/serine phosphatase